ncbi:FGGY-family carbohydrate kinase [Marinomonas rhizomae]|uniref:FGGY-family pentulose kinase n=1 Tax=Marinomonas rhizomae TaxID=491948 RepID=A0A366JF62_9GAMM|nr:FGGY-family carbohydrate kinase [Marinomonas rhizomae]RBP85583.1 FGGY-family pentulose kinase [Marinomonas rhizomae]
MAFFIGIDVGTGSARAGVFDSEGNLKSTAAQAIETYRPQENFAQQSSSEIWQAVCTATKTAIADANISSSEVVGMGFDATCSLVVTDANGGPVSVDPAGLTHQNVMLWMDHRAIEDANEINAIGGSVLKHVGGRISPEMELPKLRWMKRELPQSWQNAAQFWDLPDWLVHRATNSFTRSLCSTVCKWTYLGHKGLAGEGWDDDFLSSIGLKDLVADEHASIGSTLSVPGERCGVLTEQSAAELGLAAGIAVSASLIDAYAGALGTLGLDIGESPIDSRLAVIAGTSTCHIAFNTKPIFVPGVWGPYFGVTLPDMWALEGGQSAAGVLMDAVVARHSASVPLAIEAKKQGKRISDLIEDRLTSMAEETAFLTSTRHVQPDFHGNRSPLAEPWRKGAVVGLGMSAGLDDLALDYLATIQALAYGTRHIIEEMRAQGAVINTLVMSGGLARNTLYVREHADATGCKVLVPDQQEPVLLGCAMLGAVAAGEFTDLRQAMKVMSGQGRMVEPRQGSINNYHNNKYKVFRKMQDDYSKYNAMMMTKEK